MLTLGPAVLEVGPASLSACLAQPEPAKKQGEQALIVHEGGGSMAVHTVDITQPRQQRLCYR